MEETEGRDGGRESDVRDVGILTQGGPQRAAEKRGEDTEGDTKRKRD